MGDSPKSRERLASGNSHTTFSLASLAQSWVWVKIKPPGDPRFSSWVPFTRVPFLVPVFDPQPAELLTSDFPFCSIVSHGPKSLTFFFPGPLGS